MRILWLSNAPWASTGYGNQTQLFAPRIKRMLGHEVAIFAFYGLEGGVLRVEEGIPVVPRHNHPYGQDIAHEHGRQFKADIILSLMDAWVCDPQILQSHGAKWTPWFPVDSEPLPTAVARKVQSAYRRIIFSRFAEEMVNNTGMDCYYVPHGVNTKLFRPIDRTEARERRNLPDDKFIVGMVAANKGYPPRKAFFENLQAFKNFNDRHPDTLLILHTNSGKDSSKSRVNLAEYCETIDLDVGKHVYFPDPYQYHSGFPDDAMVDLYNIFDVHLLVSAGEGFGIPIIEAQACGCPVIVGDWTATGELCFSGWKVPKTEARPLWTPLGAYQYYPNVPAIEECLENAYRMWGNEDYRKRARKGALKYDADKVTEKYWKPVLADIEDSLQERIEVERIGPPLKVSKGVGEAVLEGA